MSRYHKIETVFKRNPETKFKTLLIGEFARPEFAYLARNEWVFTEKVDGTNIRVIVPPTGGSITFGGRTDDAQIPAFLVARLQERFLPQAARLAEMFPDGGVLYGEGYGARIQKGGGNYRPDADFVLFDVRVGMWWLERANVEDVAQKLGLDVVPIIGRGTIEDMVNRTVRGLESQWGQFAAEGIVARPATELIARNGQRIITKLKHRDFV
jgi:ATP-dependent RNA circularization protein (DNA/RNA ligase family)